MIQKCLNKLCYNVVHLFAIHCTNMFLFNMADLICIFCKIVASTWYCILNVLMKVNHVREPAWPKYFGCNMSSITSKFSDFKLHHGRLLLLPKIPNLAFLISFARKRLAFKAIYFICSIITSIYTFSFSVAVISKKCSYVIPTNCFVKFILDRWRQYEDYKDLLQSM